jgi:hypothetical protein
MVVGSLPPGMFRGWKNRERHERHLGDKGVNNSIPLR